MGSAAGAKQAQVEVIISEVRKHERFTSNEPTTPPRLPKTGAVTKDWGGVFDMESAKMDADSQGPRGGAVSAPTTPAKSPVSPSDGSMYAQVRISEPEGIEYSAEDADAAVKVLRCLEIRDKYVGGFAGKHVDAATVTIGEKVAGKMEIHGVLAQFDGDSSLALVHGAKRILWDPFSGTPKNADACLSAACEHGVFIVRDSKANNEPIEGSEPLNVEEFCADYVTVLRTMRDRSCVSFTSPRLKELELKFQLHIHRNANREAGRQRDIAGRDWYQVRKVDTHIHHSACFTQRQLMKFIRSKMRDEMDTEVMEENGKRLTLREVFSTAGVSDEDDVNADRLCCMASIGSGQYDTFGRFDVFNTKYNPFGDKRLRDIFLKTDNLLGGRYLAELTKDVMDGYRIQKFVCAEWRISIYGKKKEEWAKLAKWFRTYNIQCQQIRWLIQVPRLYPLFRKMGHVKNFAEMLQNIFEPVFEASLDPEAHEDMFYMLQQVVGFDSVDDESQGTNVTLTNFPPPEQWDSEENPPYTYWMYYIYANLRTLNALRRHRGLNTFAFRPHCGEAGNVSHLCSGFMLADGINHGVQLRESPVLQYLYYLAQIGIAVSPLSNDILFIPLEKSPFGTFFRGGLNVSLSTDDPLIIHLTEDALVEEYVVAARTFRLSNCDLCEIARNSVLQSGFEAPFKDWWVGPPKGRYEGNDEKKSNVPSIRLLFRKDCLEQEMIVLDMAANGGATCPPCGA
mmetsp:Transcript_81346/g.263945  ORF Transcript_81346/g.263945 Transcript_81346/m.263945 type:complete len:736 (-) Transcript_81346:142-2349(-)